MILQLTCTKMILLLQKIKFTMHNSSIKKKLSEAGIRATPIRMHIYEHIERLGDTFSLGDLENALLEIDKSTIFRTLTLFQEHHLIHGIDYAGGALKYCLCRNAGQCEKEENHCHFYCHNCGKTYCLDNHLETNFPMPEGFIAEQINYVVKGICQHCNQKKRP